LAKEFAQAIKDGEKLGLSAPFFYYLPRESPTPNNDGSLNLFADYFD
jgi:hypothetical protein